MTMLASLDKAKVRRSFGAAALSYDGLAELQRRVALELLNRFPPLEEDGILLDVGCGTGFLSKRLAEGAESRRLIALDLALPMLQTSRLNYPDMVAQYVCADAERLPFAAQSIRQIYSNLALQWMQDLSATLVGFRRALGPKGRLVFATFGPATLHELKSAWAAVDSYTHVNSFHDIAAIRRFLLAAGFRDICAENVLYQTSYASVQDLMRELKGIGARNVNQGRNRQPTTRSQLQRMIAFYQKQMPGAEIIASYEIIFVKAEVA